MVYIKYLLLGDFVYGGCFCFFKGVLDEFIGILRGF